MNRVPFVVLAAVGFSTFLVFAASAAVVSRSYCYFSLRGSTIQDLQAEMERRGPEVEGTGKRHPGATRLQFKDRVRYRSENGKCSVLSVVVTVKARIILPRWVRRSSGSAETREIWDALASDIKRHEESHVSIAKNHARDIEQAISGISPQNNCDLVAARARKALVTGLARHDAEQARFDLIEGKNFSARIERLIRYRAGQ